MVCLVDDMQKAWDASFGSGHRSHSIRDIVIKRYLSSGLAYHNLEHIHYCLQLLQRFKALAVHPTEVAWALWYHDIVYNPRRSDNEKKSAALARKHLAEMNVKGALFLGGVHDLIMATKHKGGIVTPDCALMVDIDLAILGASREGYDRYASAIRKEYSFVGHKSFKKGRAAVMQSFLDRATIYHTPDFQHHFEARARENIAREIQSLTA